MGNNTATLSADRMYRYTLTREVNMFGNGEAALFLMLNPSTADEAADDPTVTRCMGFARRWGYSTLHVANLFAFRATSPADLKMASDPIGPGNDRYLVELAERSGVRVAAWGVHGELMGRNNAVKRLVGRLGLKALGFTKAGHPRHPLYVPKTAELLDYATEGTQQD